MFTSLCLFPQNFGVSLRYELIVVEIVYLLQQICTNRTKKAKKGNIQLYSSGISSTRSFSMKIKKFIPTFAIPFKTCVYTSDNQYSQENNIMSNFKSNLYIAFYFYWIYLFLFFIHSLCLVRSIYYHLPFISVISLFYVQNVG